MADTPKPRVEPERAVWRERRLHNGLTVHGSGNRAGSFNLNFNQGAVTFTAFVVRADLEALRDFLDGLLADATVREG